MMTGLNHITIAVNDLELSFKFYVDVLQMTPKARWSTGAYLTLGDTWFCLSKDQALPSQDYSHIALSIDAENFSEFSQMLKDLGVVEWKKNRSEGDSIYLLDPSGNKLEVHCGNLESRLNHLKAEDRDDLVFY